MVKSYNSNIINCINANHTLIIVESFSKCKKIEDFLGLNYKCIASGGHLRELKNIKNIGEDNNYIPTFEVINTSFVKRNLKKLKVAIREANDVILATDDDREGEAIAWHICILFKLDILKTKRIKFNEITKTAILNSLQNVSVIDMNIVNAQQSRQIMDLLVGYKISPILWKYFTYNSSSKNGLLSAGRCQTPTLKIIYDNHLKIIANNKTNDTDMTYTTTSLFSSNNIQYKLNHKFKSSNDVTIFLNDSKQYSNILQKSSFSKSIKNQPLPLNTSALQQQSNIKLNLSPKTTMNICQKLYDGGFITYIRTDSKRYNNTFINNVTTLIKLNYGDDYINKNNNKISTSTSSNSNKSTNNIQNAHESIRPTNIHLKTLPVSCSKIENSIYNLIYKITLQSCMSPSLYDILKSKISAPSSLYYENELEQPYFMGWEIFNQRSFISSIDKFECNKSKLFKNTIQTNNNYYFIKSYASNTEIKCKKIVSQEKLDNNILHLTEAKLINMLEGLGIGRPSTYSSLVEKIQDRGYVIKQDYPGIDKVCNCFNLDLLSSELTITNDKITKTFGAEKNKLCITSLGYIVIYFLSTNYNELFNYEYTKNMEIDIDLISSGDKNKIEVCGACNNQINNLILNKSQTYPQKFAIRVDDKYSLIIGKYGLVIKQNIGNNFYQVKNITNLDIKKIYNNEYLKDDLMDPIMYIENGEENDEEKEEINDGGLYIGMHKENRIVLKQGKYGYYTTFNGVNISLSKLGKRPMENIKLDEIINIIITKNNYIRTINDYISIREGKGKLGNYIYYKTENMKKPMFLTLKKFTKYCKISNIDDNICPYKCDKEIIINWVISL
jgi:DNA topoisomerase-1